MISLQDDAGNIVKCLLHPNALKNIMGRTATEFNDKTEKYATTHGHDLSEFQPFAVAKKLKSLRGYFILRQRTSNQMPTIIEFVAGDNAPTKFECPPYW